MMQLLSALDTHARTACETAIDKLVPASKRDGWFDSERALILNLMLYAYCEGYSDGLAAMRTGLQELRNVPLK